MSIISLYSPSRYQLHVLARFLLSVFGGYILAAITSSLLAHLLPLNAVDSVLTATTLSVVFYAVFFILVFAVKKLKTAFSVFFTLSFLQLVLLSVLRGIL